MLYALLRSSLVFPSLEPRKKVEKKDEGGQAFGFRYLTLDARVYLVAYVDALMLTYLLIYLLTHSLTQYY